VAAAREIEGEAVVVQVEGSALQAGLEVGSAVLSVDGLPVEPL
jgi:predicted metalloprotease with PDZ domain